MQVTRRTLALLAAATTLGGAGPDGYPARTVRIVVGFPPGGTTDLVARLIAARLTDRLGRTFVVENRPGASGAIGSEAVARAAADGQTLEFVTINTHGINSAVFKSLPYDPVRDFAPISEVVASPNVVSASPASGIASLADMLRQAKEKPGQLVFGSTGIGGSPHMSGVLLQAMTGVSMKHVPYKGGGPMLNDLMAGHIPLAFDNLPSSMEQIRSGAIRGLMVTTRERSPNAPDLPSIAETVPGYDVAAWFGLVAPARTPEVIVQFLAREVADILREPEMRRRLNETGAVPVGNSPAEFRAVISAEVEKWKHVAEVASVQIN
jgi:tripartite-type tricarboxylate transporter receptor subunit TctC